MEHCAKNGVITLTGNEESLFAMLRMIVTDLRLGTVVRVAGGWVRDKLLYGATKDDVDLCLDNMTGEQFCHHMNEWSKGRGQQVYKYGIIQSNPEKSKHLATATVKINGLEVDFVNLRSETYVEHSRIPIVEFGSPLEDARRRDLTVNSLFYNIHTDEIEDFTGSGLEDMKNKILRTPLDPLVTLIDDPLRTFRVLRFACRLNFHIVGALLHACRAPEVIASLHAKVSRERILKETEGTLTGDQAQSARAVFLLHRLDLLRCLLMASRPDDTYPHAVLPDGVTEPMTEEAFSAARERGACLMMLTECISFLVGVPGTSGPLGGFAQLCGINAAMITPRESYGKDTLVRRFATLTHPFDKITVVNPLKPTKQISLSDHILQNEIKVPTKSVAVCGTLQRGACEFRRLMTQYWDLEGETPGRGSKPDRGVLGSLVKDCGAVYQEAIFIATAEMLLDILLSDVTSADLIDAIAKQLNIHEAEDGGAFAGPSAGGQTVFARASAAAGASAGPSVLELLSSERCRRVLACADELTALIINMDLHEVWLQQPIVRGNELKTLLPNLRAGPIFSEIVREEFLFRMLNPTADAPTIAAHIQEKYSDYR